MKYKLTLIAASAALFCSSASAMLFVCGEPKSPRNYSDIKIWYNSVYNQDTQLKGTPSKRDEVIFGSGETNIDTDLEVATLVIGQAGIVKIDKRRIATKGLIITAPQRASAPGSPLLEIKNTSANLGGFVINESMRRQDKLGRINLSLDNANVIFKEINLGMGGASADLKPFDNGSGLFIKLKGASTLTISNGFFLDEMFKNAARLQFELVESDGKVPCVLIDKPDPSYVMLDVTVKTPLKKGRYPILQDLGRNPLKGDLRSIKVNGSERKINETFNIEGKDARLVLDYAGKDNKKNDIILEVL